MLSEVGGTTVCVCIYDCTATSKDSGRLLLSSINHFRKISNVVQVPFINLKNKMGVKQRFSALKLHFGQNAVQMSLGFNYLHHYLLNPQQRYWFTLTKGILSKVLILKITSKLQSLVSFNGN